MKDEDIFDLNTYEEWIEFNECKLRFALARKCRLDHFKKIIGVNFSMNIQEIDCDKISELMTSLNDDLNFELKPGSFIKVNMQVYNFDENNYGKLNDSIIFGTNINTWYTHELNLKSYNIGDDSNVKIKFDFEIIKVDLEKNGFLKKKYVITKKSIACKDSIELTSILDGERKHYENNESWG